MNAKEKVEVLRQQVNALLTIEREMMQERQAELEGEANADPAVERSKPPKSDSRYASISEHAHRRKSGTGVLGR